VSADAAGAPIEPKAARADASGRASEEELRAAYDAELSRITSTDMMLQASVSLLNIASRRLGAPPTGPAGGSEAPAAGPGTPAQGLGAEAAGRDLEQVRDAIDGIRALLAILERRLPRELGPLRDALSQLQMAYAREVQLGGGEAKPAAGQARERGADAAGAHGAAERQGQGGSSQQEDSPGGGERPKGPGPAEASGRLWVPGR
jgi:hypothetical protein